MLKVKLIDETKPAEGMLSGVTETGIDLVTEIGQG